MLKKIALVFALAFTTGLSFAQSTTVSVTVVDSTAQTWYNGTITYQFQGNGQSSGPYQWQGANLSNQYLTPTTVTLDGTGSATFTLPSNQFITPSGSTFVFTVCPNASIVLCQSGSTVISGATQNISTFVTSFLQPIVIQAATLPKAYADSQVKTVPNVGSFYMNTGTSTPGPRLWSGSGWASMTGATGAVFTPNAVQYATSSTASRAAVGSDFTSIFASPPAIGSTTPAAGYFTNIKVAVTNPPLQNNVGYYGSYVPCKYTTTPTDPGGQYLFHVCSGQSYQEYFPGFYYGNPGIGSDVGVFVHTVMGDPITYNNDYSAGIGGYLNGAVNVIAPGDYNYIGTDAEIKQRWAYGSDEGYHSWRDFVREQGEGFYTVAPSGGGSGANDIYLTCVNNCNTLSLNTPLIDLTSGVLSGTISGVTTSSIYGVQAATTSYTNPVSTTGTFAAAVDVPRTINNTTNKLSAATITVNVNTSTPITVGELIGTTAYPFYEVVKTTAVGTWSGGVQSITASFHYSHANGSAVCIGGSVGSYLELTNYTIGTNRYLENVMCSPAANTIWFGHQSQAHLQTGAAAAGGVIAGPVKQYQGGEIYGVVNPGTGLPSSGYAYIGGNNAAWADNDSVQNTNDISAYYAVIAQEHNIANPWAVRIAQDVQWNNYGGSLNTLGNFAWRFTNFNTDTIYKGTSGGSALFTAPSAMALDGPIGSVITSHYAPIPATGNVNNCISCLGWYIAANGPSPDATSHLFQLAAPQPNNYPDGITYNYDTRVWNMIGSAALQSNGVAVSTNGPLTGTITLTTAGADAVTITGVTISSRCSFTPTNATAAGLTSVTGAIWISKAANTVTLNHATTTATGATYDLLCSIN